MRSNDDDATKTSETRATGTSAAKSRVTKVGAEAWNGRRDCLISIFGVDKTSPQSTRDKELSILRTSRLSQTRERHSNTVLGSTYVPLPIEYVYLKEISGVFLY